MEDSQGEGRHAKGLMERGGRGSKALQPAMGQTVSVTECLAQILGRAGAALSETQHSHSSQSQQVPNDPSTSTPVTDRPRRKIQAMKKFSPDE